jgi:conjugal transfer ATP-binding protein TraC
LSALPGHWFFNRRTHKFDIAAVTHFLPAHRPWQGVSDMKMLFPTAGGELIGLDMFAPELPAKHGLIIGSTGSGKSFTTNYILTNFLIESPKNSVVIIDVGGSYRKLCELFDGQYIDVRYEDACSFNPFPSKEYFFDEEGKPDADSLSFLSLIVQKMLKKETFSGRETMIVENTLVKTYRAAPPGRAPSLGDFARALEDFAGDEEDKATAVSFYKDLGPWVKGRYSILLNNPNPRLVLDPKKQLIVFDLQKIKDEPDLGPVMFFVVRSAIQSRLADLSCNKIIVIDEGWQFFSDAVGAALVENLYRTARKFGGAVFSISQSPEDFLKTPAATSIISNAYTKFILRLTARCELLEQLGLNPSEIEEVKALEMVPGKYSEVFYKFLGHCVVLRIQPNPLDYWICTTNDKDKNKEDAMRKKHPDLSPTETILKLAGEDK